MHTYIKNPKPISAIQFTYQNAEELRDLSKSRKDIFIKEDYDNNITSIIVLSNNVYVKINNTDWIIIDHNNEIQIYSDKLFRSLYTKYE
jgi:hypothetical protein